MKNSQPSKKHWLLTFYILNLCPFIQATFDQEIWTHIFHAWYSYLKALFVIRFFYVLSISPIAYAFYFLI